MTNNSIQTNEGALILDSHKLEHHYDRVEAWDAGEKIAPVSVDMALTPGLWRNVFLLLCYGPRTAGTSDNKVKKLCSLLMILLKLELKAFH